MDLMDAIDGMDGLSDKHGQSNYDYGTMDVVDGLTDEYGKSNYDYEDEWESCLPFLIIGTGKQVHGWHCFDSRGEMTWPFSRESLVDRVRKRLGIGG